jgi:L-histidine Nalpha-methyltransferase
VGQLGKAGVAATGSYFERDDHRRNVLACLTAGKVPLKYAYAGSAARAHDRYARTASYTEMMASAALEADALIASGCRAGELEQIVEIGPGNGRHSAALLGCLRLRGVDPARYLGLDFSRSLLTFASQRLREQNAGRLGVDIGGWDVERATTGRVAAWRHGPGALLVCLVGGTLGNFEDPARALRHIAAACRPGDLLLASVLTRAPHTPAAAGGYDSREFRHAATEPLIAAGMKASDMRFTVGFRDGGFVGEAALLRDIRIGGLRLTEGHRIRCFLSRRFAGDDVLDIFAHTGWLIRATAVAPGGHHLAVVVSRAEEPT